MTRVSGIDWGKAIESPRSLSVPELTALLDCDDAALWDEIFMAAREVKHKYGKDEILPRGLIECSNVCVKDCLYCGIRKSNASIKRYRMSEGEVLACCSEARERGYGAVAFQAGEVESDSNTAFYEYILRQSDLEVTLSLGEQRYDVYRRWKEAGAKRYLIRIETSNRALYEALHPCDCSFDRRVECIRSLKQLGYVTGTGVMVGIPGQTSEDLARDIVFFGSENADMVGMGPYIPHPCTPLAAIAGAWTEERAARAFVTGVRMIALTRLYMHDINIVAATTLEVLGGPNGRNAGIDAGANVVMPNLTPKRFRTEYELYPGKSQINLV